jgi:exosortase/archaeosortase family protein
MIRHPARYAAAGVAALQFAAFWPVWQWYAARLILFPENRVGLLAAATAIAFLGWKAVRGEVRPAPLLVPTCLLILYALLFPFVRPLVSTAIAAASLAYTLVAIVAPRARWGVLALALLALPVIPSMQTYLGYPLRVASGAVAAPWLSLSGIDVVREGTCLRWAETVISIDEPCSGIRMLWTALFLAAAIACFREMRFLHAAAAGAVSIVAVLAANTLRTVSLFYLESGIVQGPAWAHDAVGILFFAAGAAGIVWACLRLAGRSSPCTA